MAKVALITGGAKGIGRAIGLDLAAAGWDIALCYRTSEREAAETAARITKAGRRAIAERCDVSDPAAAEAFVRKVEKEFGAVDALINCAGPYHRVNILDETPAGWTAMFAHNLHAVFYMSKAGVLILTRTLAKALAPYGITVNAISPGFINSGSAPEAELAGMVKKIPAGYVGELKDPVSAVRFLLSDEARYVTGTNIHLSGGWGI